MQVIEDIQEFQGRLGGAFDRYKECCEKYGELLHESCEKYRSVEEQFQSQRLRVQEYNKKMNSYISNAVELEMTRLEIEIKQKERRAATGLTSI